MCKYFYSTLSCVISKSQQTLVDGTNVVLTRHTSVSLSLYCLLLSPYPSTTCLCLPIYLLFVSVPLSLYCLSLSPYPSTVCLFVSVSLSSFILELSVYLSSQQIVKGSRETATKKIMLYSAKSRPLSIFIFDTKFYTCENITLEKTNLRRLCEKYSFLSVSGFPCLTMMYDSDPQRTIRVRDLFTVKHRFISFQS